MARKSLPRTNQNSPSAFSHQIRNNSKKDKTKTSQMMGWIENRPNKSLNENFVRQGLPAKCKSVRFRFISLMCCLVSSGAFRRSPICRHCSGVRNIMHIDALCSPHRTKNNQHNSSTSTQPQTQPRTMSDSTICPCLLLRLWVQ